MIVASLLCLAFPLLLLFAAWHDVSTMWIPNWVSIALGAAFIPAALAVGLTVPQIGMHLIVGGIALLVCVILFFLNVFGGGDAKVIAAASLWVGLPGMTSFVFWMALAGGILGLVLLIARRMKLKPTREWSKRLLSPETGAPYAVAIAIGGFFAAPHSQLLAAALAGFAA
jgi:prepilin peptidase CpaA